MMKSFFKKLAFVMALAMVVTMAAPAGKAALAASFYISKQENKEEVTNFNLAVGAEQDFRYIGATDYTKYNFVWKSDKTDVATVTNAGVVKGVKDGVAVITCTGTSKADGKTVGYTASMVVTVGKGDAPIAVTADYAVKQDTAETVKIMFNNAKEYTVEDFELFYVIDGGWTISWPIKSVNPAKDAAGNVIDGQYILTPYVQFSDGDKYILKVDGEDEGTEFVTSFGKLTHLEVHYKCNGLTDQNAVVNTIDSKDVYEVECFVKFFSGDVDVSSLYKEQAKNVVYEMKSSNEGDIKFKKNGELTFKKVGVAAVVTATYEYKDKVTGEKMEVKSNKAVPIVSVPLPEYNLTLVDWAIIDIKDKNLDSYEKIDWSVKEIRANDDSDTDTDYRIVAKFTDCLGKNFLNFEEYLPKSEGKVKDGWYGPKTDGTTFDKGKYSLVYSSANNDKLLIGASDAKITTHTEADVAVIVGLYSTDKKIMKKTDGFVKNVAAFTVEVDEERYIADIELSEDDVELPNAATETKYTDTFVKKTVKLYIFDQYGDQWTKELSTAVKTDGFKTETETKGAGFTDAIVYTDHGVYGWYAEIKLDGNKLCKLSPEADGETVSYTITVGEESVDLDVTPYNVLKTGSTTDVDYYEVPELTVKDVEIAVNDDVKLPREAAIALTYFSSYNDLAVGYANGVHLYNDVSINEETGLEDFSKVKYAVEGTKTTAGEYFLAVYAPNGSLVGKAEFDSTTGKATKLGVYQKDNGTFALLAAADINGDKVLDYLDPGEYKVELRLTSWETGYDKDEKEFTYLATDDEEEAVINVTNNSNAIEFVGLSEVKTTKTDFKQIVKDLVNVEVAGKTWKFATEDILKVEGRYNADAKQIIIKKIWFNVALDAATAGTEAMGYEASVEVNRAIEVPKTGFTNPFNANGIWTNTTR